MKKNLLLIMIVFLAGCAVNQSRNENINYNDLGSLNNAIKHNPKDFNLYIYRAKFYANNNMLDNAQNDYKSALQLSANNESVKKQYADFLCYKKMDQYSASVFYSDLIKNESSPIDVYIDYATCENMVGNTDGAIDLYVKALGFNNPPLSAYKGIVDIYMKQGNFAIANYYAELYKGPQNEELLKMQIDTLSNLLMSKQKINNRADLELQLSNLKKQYSLMSGNNVSYVPESKNYSPIVVTDVPVNDSTTKKIEPDTKQFGERVKKDPSGRQYIVVLPSETLYRIHVYTKVPVNTLEKLNNIKNSTIKTGDKIFIN